MSVGRSHFVWARDITMDFCGSHACADWACPTLNGKFHLLHCFLATMSLKFQVLQPARLHRLPAAWLPHLQRITLMRFAPSSAGPLVIGIATIETCTRRTKWSRQCPISTSWIMPTKRLNHLHSKAALANIESNPLVDGRALVLVRRKPLSQHLRHPNMPLLHQRFVFGISIHLRLGPQTERLTSRVALR